MDQQFGCLGKEMFLKLFLTVLGPFLALQTTSARQSQVAPEGCGVFLPQHMHGCSAVNQRQDFHMPTFALNLHSFLHEAKYPILKHL